MPDHEKRAEQARRRAEDPAAIRLRYCINTHLDEQGITTPADLARATGLPAAEAAEAAGLLRRKQWREGDVAALRALAARLGLAVPLEGLDPASGGGPGG